MKLFQIIRSARRRRLENGAAVLVASDAQNVAEDRPGDGAERPCPTEAEMSHDAQAPVRPSRVDTNPHANGPADGASTDTGSFQNSLSEPARPQEFPVDALGVHGRAAALAAHEITQAPLTMCAHATLFSMAAAVQARANIELPFGKLAPISLFLIDIGESSERKSTVVGMLSSFLTKHEQNLELTYQAELAEWKRQKAADTEEEIPFPLKARVIVQEPTYEGLLKTLDEGPGSAVLLNDDAGDFISGHAMNAENRVKTGAGLSRLWSGDTVVRPRISGDVVVRGKRFSLYLLAQGKTAEKLVGDEMLRDQGFLSRIPVTWPDSMIGRRRFRMPSPEARQQIEKYNERMLALISATPPYRPGTRNELELPSIRFNAEGIQYWAEFHDEVELSCRVGCSYEDVRGFAGKMAENVARIAAVLTLVEDEFATEVSNDAVKAAVEIGRFHLHEKVRLMNLGERDANTENADLLRRWLKETWSEDHVSRTEVQQYGPNRLRKDLEKIQAALRVLQEQGLLAKADGNVTIRGHRRREAWKVIR